MAIQVFDKDGHRVAVFNKPANGAVAQGSIINPIVHTQLDGESTFTFTILRDSKKWADVKDLRNEWHVNGRIYKALSTEAVRYEGDTITVILVEKWYELANTYVQAHNVDLEVEAMDEHTVKILPKSPTTNKLTVNGVEYNDSEVKDGRGITMPRGSAGYALWAVLKGNRFGWSLGVCDVLVDGFDPDEDYGVFNLESDMKDVLTNIKNIRTLWGGVLVYDSIAKTVSLRDADKIGTDFNTWVGYDVRYGKNMLAEPVITVDNNIVTKAYILGDGNLNIKAVNNDKTYLENYSYTDEVYEGYLVNPNIKYTGAASTSGQTQLKYWGQRELRDRCKPKENYSVQLYDRREEPDYAHETFQIGDIVRVYARSTDGSELEVKELRVIDWSYDVWNMSEATVLIGDKLINVVEMFKLAYDNSTVDNPKFDWNGSYEGDDVHIKTDGGYVTLSQYMSDTVVSIANIYTYADATYATISLVTQYQAETAQGFIDTESRITQVSSELGSEITLSASAVRSDARGYANAAESDANDYTDMMFGQGYLVVSDNGVEMGGIDNDSKMHFEIDNANNEAVLSAVNADLKFWNQLGDIRLSSEGNISLDANSSLYISAHSLGSGNLYVGRRPGDVGHSTHSTIFYGSVDFSSANVTGVTAKFG